MNSAEETLSRAWRVPEIVEMRLPLSLGRDFSAHALVATHRQLLLRSAMGDVWPDRVDLLFKGVLSVKVNISVPQLSIHRADAAQLEQIEKDTGLDIAAGMQANAYVLTGGDFSGYVVAASLWMARDQQHASNPSPLLFDIEGTGAPEKIWRLE